LDFPIPLPLDIPQKLPSIAYMKAAFVVGLFLAMAASQTFAQGTALESTTTNTVTVAPSPAISPLVLEKVTVKQDVIDTQHLRLSGPLVRPMKAKRLREVPRRLFHAINPFAPQEDTDEFKGMARVSSQAWTTTVGWHPGASAFADPVTHESKMGLISVSRP
jgi:hypothetical protein